MLSWLRITDLMAEEDMKLSGSLGTASAGKVSDLTSTYISMLHESPSFTREVEFKKILLFYLKSVILNIHSI